MMLDEAFAERLAMIALGHVGREYPHKLDHVLNGDADAAAPRALHPVFFGSFDWHSCVHGWWLLLTLRQRFPALAARIDRQAAATFTPIGLDAELAYLDRPNSGGFERPYGWAWLLALHGAAGPWQAALEPLARALAARFAAFLPRATYPIRSGSHTNTAFACALAHDWAVRHDPALASQIAERVVGWYGHDRAAQAWEPDGDAFLSPVLTSAVAMLRVTDAPTFAAWLGALLPDAADHRPAALFTSAEPSDRSDGKIAHLDGLNLSRAWCWREIASALAPAHPLAPVASAAADEHLIAGLPHVSGDYAGEHWLASFALLALLA